MMVRISLFLLALAAPAAADDWSAMSGSDIAAALNGVTLEYSNAIQSFFADGSTEYVAGRPSLGRWEVRGDQYCSVWPPSDHWACYDMMQKPGQLRFIGAAGDITDGQIKSP